LLLEVGVERLGEVEAAAIKERLAVPRRLTDLEFSGGRGGRRPALTSAETTC
jgi:hypothetical protein